MLNYSSVNIAANDPILLRLLNQMVRNDLANEELRKISLDQPLAIAVMDDNRGTSSAAPTEGATANALYYAANTVAGVTWNVDNVINAPLSIEISIERAGIYRFYVVASMASGEGTCVPALQIVDKDSSEVQEVANFITSGEIGASDADNSYTPTVLWVDRWLYAGKTYTFTVTTGLYGTTGDIAYVNAYKNPPFISYFWVQGYNGTGRAIEIPYFSNPLLDFPGIDFDSPDFDFNFDFDFPNFDFPDFDFPDFGGIDAGTDIPEFGIASCEVESFDSPDETTIGPVLNWRPDEYDGQSRGYPSFNVTGHMVDYKYTGGAYTDKQTVALRSEDSLYYPNARSVNLSYLANNPKPADQNMYAEVKVIYPPVVVAVAEPLPTIPVFSGGTFYLTDNNIASEIELGICRTVGSPGGIFLSLTHYVALSSHPSYQAIYPSKNGLDGEIAGNNGVQDSWTVGVYTVTESGTSLLIGFWNYYAFTGGIDGRMTGLPWPFYPQIDDTFSVQKDGDNIIVLYNGIEVFNGINQSTIPGVSPVPLDIGSGTCASLGMEGTYFTGGLHQPSGLGDAYYSHTNPIPSDWFLLSDFKVCANGEI